MPTLRWLTRDDDVRAAERVPYRLLEEVQGLGAGDRDAGNMLIQGDNLEALKALLPYYAGAVKCIYIDPPFNTGSAFEHYDDGVEHSTWLGLMKVRLDMLRDLLSEDGLICVHLDDSEAAYAKVLLDEVMGRANYCNMITTKTNDPSGFKATGATIFSTSNYILIYAKNKATKPIKRLFIPKGYDTGYNKFLLCERTKPTTQWVWTGIGEAYATSMGFKNTRQAKKVLGDEFDEALPDFAIKYADRVFQLVAIGGGAAKKRASTIKASRECEDVVFVHPDEDVPDFYIANGRQMVFYEKRLLEVDGKKIPAEILTDFWSDISWNGISGEGGVDFKNGKKPEAIVERVLQMATNPGDLVLDSFLGSGTTAAVAQKMGRRYIGIEMGDHAVSHCVPRLKKVIEGEQGGISKAQNWQGGGGFRFYRLGPPVFGEDGQISPDIRFATLAAHVWFAETGTPWTAPDPLLPFLGQQDGRGFALLYNGILGDRSVSGGNVLTRATLARIREGMAGFAGPLTVYGERTALSEASLRDEGITFKQTPYDVRARK